LKEIFLIRHGETDYNKKGIVQGRGVNPSLNEKGMSQADSFFQKYQNEPFEIVYTSTLKRAIESVQSFIDKKIPHEIYSELDEIGWGDFEGREVDDYFRSEFKRIIGEWQSGNLEEKTINGESPLELQQKHFQFINILNSRPEKKILMCMHGRAMRILLCTLLNKSLSEMDNFPHYNLSLYRLVYDGKEFKLTTFNDLSHLHVEV